MLFRVLVALPDETSLGACCGELSACGYAVERARTGLDCLERLNACEFDLVVLDAGLTWGSGVGVVAVLADDPEVRFLPAIILAADRAVGDHHPNVAACVPGHYSPGVLPALIRTLFPLTE